MLNIAIFTLHITALNGEISNIKESSKLKAHLQNITSEIEHRTCGLVLSKCNTKLNSSLSAQGMMQCLFSSLRNSVSV